VQSLWWVHEQNTLHALSNVTYINASIPLWTNRSLVSVFTLRENPKSSVSHDPGPFAKPVQFAYRQTLSPDIPLHACNSWSSLWRKKSELNIVFSSSLFGVHIQPNPGVLGHREVLLDPQDHVPRSSLLVRHLPGALLLRGHPVVLQVHPRPVRMARLLGRRRHVPRVVLQGQAVQQ
jgi:hypothetical protein